MKLMTVALAAIMVKAMPVMASGGQEAADAGLLVFLFLGLGSLIIVCQFIPGLILFCSMLKGLFGGAAAKSAPRREA